MNSYNGEGAPELTLGEIGDQYIDTLNNIVYKKSDYSTWTQVDEYPPAEVSDTAYNATSWNDDTDTAPSKNAVRDKIESLDSAKQNSSFTPTTAGDWDGPPASIQAALDELAARVKVLEP